MALWQDFHRITKTGLNFWRTFGLDDGVSVYEGRSMITRELVDSTFPDTSPVFWATLRCADGCRARPVAWEEGLQQGRDRAGESGSSRARESKRRAGFCPSEGTFIFNKAVTWLEPSKVLFQIGREEEMGCDFKSWKKAVHVQDTHYDHCFCVNYRIPGEAVCSGAGASRVHGC